MLGTVDDIITSLSVATFAGRDPEDVSYDVTNRGLWIIDGLNAEVYRVRPGANNEFDGVAPDGDDVLTQFPRPPSTSSTRRDYLDPASGNLILTSSDPTLLYEVSTGGVLLDISHRGRQCGEGCRRDDGAQQYDTGRDQLLRGRSHDRQRRGSTKTMAAYTN